MNSQSSIASLEQVFVRLQNLQNKFMNSNDVDARRCYFNIASSVVRNYQKNVYGGQCPKINTLISNSPFYNSVLRVINSCGSSVEVTPKIAIVEELKKIKASYNKINKLVAYL